MRELADVLATHAALADRAATAVLATLVQARGSTYRRPGARMILTEERPPVGAISGGCLERDVARRAWFLTEAGPAVVTYDSRRDDEDGDDDHEDIRWGFGLGCEGAVDVLLERLDRGPAAASLTFASACRRKKDRGVVATVFRAGGADAPPAGARLLLDADGIATDVGWSGSSALCARLHEAAREAMTSGRSTALELEADATRIEAFVEVIDPPLPLLVCGAGYDAVPLVDLGASLGWDVTVLAERAADATLNRFSRASRIVAGAPGQLRDLVSLDARTAVVVMSHNYPRDRALVAELLDGPAFYLGVLGPRRRTERMLASFADEGREVGPGARARMHGPVGLDLGAEGPEEVALAVAAEILARTTGRSGGSLRDRLTPIHP